MSNQKLVIVYDGRTSKGKNILYLIDNNGNVEDITLKVCESLNRIFDPIKDITQLSPDFKLITKYNNVDGTCNYATYLKILHLNHCDEGSEIYKLASELDIGFDITSIETNLVDFKDLKLNKYRGIDSVICDYV